MALTGHAHPVFIAIASIACTSCSPPASAPRSTTPQFAPAVIPAPRAATPAQGAFHLSAKTAVRFTPAGESVAGYFIDLVKRTRDFELERNSSGEPAEDEIYFELTAREGAFGEEGYSLSVSPRRIVVSAGDSRGLFYGAVSLWQLVTANSAGEHRIPAMTIADGPRFRWRGLMLDSARHYQSPEFIRKLIDVMALHKLNVLHWHLTDDQGWRLEIKKYPKLTSVGAWRIPAGPAAAEDIDPATGQPRLYGGFYSQEQVREIVAYAAARHITIIPEIEMPGHASAAIAAYPELGNGCALCVVRCALNEDTVCARRTTESGQLPRSALSGRVPSPESRVPADWGVYPNLFNIDDSTFAFLEDVLTEVMELFPGEYIHIGGDEAVKDQWRASAAVQKRMRELGLANEDELQSWFVRRIEKFLNARGRRLIGWDEILEGGLAPNATVMSWRGIDGAVAAASAGHDAVLSPHPVLYFDHRPLDTPRPPGRGLVVSVEDVYRFDPAPAALSGAQRKHIVGVQANIWTEHIRTEDRVEYMTFPRAAALAEVAWSPSERIDWTSFTARLPAQLERYRALDVGFAQERAASRSSDRRRTSHELELCSSNLVLSLEDDAPIRGERAVFLVDIMNPCWIYEDADLSTPVSISAAVGQTPFNFQIGDDAKKIPLHPPATASGELEVRLDGCDGPKIGALPLAPAANQHAVTELAPATLDARGGKRHLCLMFTRGAVDPIWLIDSVEITGMKE